MLRISKEKYDNNYPYRIYDAWGGVCYCSTEDLEALKKDLDKFFEIEKKFEKTLDK